MERLKTHSKLTKGVLKESYEKLLKNFYNIDPKVHAKAYEGAHPFDWAEPEFAGKYLDLCATYYEQEGDLQALENGAVVVEGIAANQWTNGYLGALSPGQEYEMFGVWNTAFTIFGLLSYEKAVTEGGEKTSLFQKSAKDALECAKRAGAWIIESFMGGVEAGKRDILDAINGGSQHITPILSLVRLYKREEDPKVKEFLLWLLKRLEGSDMDVVHFQDLMQLRSRKGIEMITVYLGLLEWGISQGDEYAIEAAKRYWKQIWETQIRNTGCGTVNEWWTEGGNGAMILPTEIKPNENCVAVGWAELTLALLFLDPKPEYGDALERTLFNHLLGSLSPDGTDFAYYQGNVGQKVYTTREGLYQCCRYRGYVLFANLPQAAFCRKEDKITPVFYTSAEYISEEVTIRETTDWPRSGEVCFECIPAKEQVFTLMLRIPGWAEQACIKVVSEDGLEHTITAKAGFCPVEIKGYTTVQLSVPFKVRMKFDRIEGEDYGEICYGPLLLAADTRFGTPLEDIRVRAGDEGLFRPVYNIPGTLLCLTRESDGMTVADYASAGGENPEKDEFAVWIRA
ncbi:MAG: glycoside hydrolase family 127 protein [Lachnospiraceae bacterium]|nr:glycoside hydrolase family 127 protein [Lachnospiraceae bacterium]